MFSSKKNSLYTECIDRILPFGYFHLEKEKCFLFNNSSSKKTYFGIIRVFRQSHANETWKDMSIGSQIFSTHVVNLEIMIIS